MSFECPICTHQTSLKISSSIELPSDGRSDEITVQIIKCLKCKFAGVAVYEESRRGGFEDESYSHFGFHIPKDELTRLKSLISKCPDKKNQYCECETHQMLGVRNENGRWVGLSPYQISDQFWLK